MTRPKCFGAEDRKLSPEPKTSSRTAIYEFTLIPFVGLNPSCGFSLPSFLLSKTQLDRGLGSTAK